MTKRAPHRALVLLIASLFALACAAAERPIVLPIRLIGNFAIVTANIDGNEVPLVLDTGNSASVALTQAVLDRVKALPTGDSSKGMDAKGNVIKYPKFRIPRFQIGTAVFTDVIAELDVHDPSYQATQVSQQGFLGTSLLKAYRVVLDYRHRRITLLPSGSVNSGSTTCSGPSVPFSTAWHGEPAAEAEIDLGRLTVWWDTGAPTSMLGKRFTDASRSQLSGDTVTSKRLAFGGTDFGPLQFAVEDLALPPGFDGFIGYNFFAGHVVCFDFPEKRILIRR
jgi:hypothetical protein